MEESAKIEDTQVSKRDSKYLCISKLRLQQQRPAMLSRVDGRCMTEDTERSRGRTTPLELFHGAKTFIRDINPSQCRNT